MYLQPSIVLNQPCYLNQHYHFLYLHLQSLDQTYHLSSNRSDLEPRELRFLP